MVFDSRKMELERWDKNIVLPTRIIITGKTNSGKSHLLLYLLYWMCDNIDELIVISPTLEPGEFEDITVPAHIHGEYNPDIITELWERVAAAKEKKNIMIVLDDSAFDIKKNDKSLSRVFTSGRHFGLSIVVITQKFRLLNQAIRSNSDYIVVSKTVNALERDAIYSECSVEDKKMFMEALARYTMNYGVLVINNLSGDAGGEENLMCDKAPAEIPKFYIEEEVLALEKRNRRREVGDEKRRDREREERMKSAYKE